MAWEVTSYETQDEWFESVVKTALDTKWPELPPAQQKIGDVAAQWFFCEPKIAFIHTAGGNPDERAFAEWVLREQLRSAGIEQAKYTFDHGMEKTADWNDIMAKAKRLIQAGNVTLLRNGVTNIIGHVVGDHGEYQSEISREDPDSRVITQWNCECPWDQYAFQRTRQWKKYEGRPCAHVLATYWKASSTPLDEEYDPTNPGMPQGPGQGDLFSSPTGQVPAGGGGGISAPGAPNQQMAIPGLTPPPGQAADPGIIPPPPQEQAPPAVSVPGLRQPTPANPVQYPGGTYSKVAWDLSAPGQIKDYVLTRADEGNLQVRLDVPEMGVAIGKSQEFGAGSYKDIPRGSIGTFMEQDKTTGECNVIFAGPQENAGPMEPYHIQAWVSPKNLTPMLKIKPPGPFIRRR